jgi:hypothetical protein
MTEKPKKLSETARALLTAAAARDDHLIQPPQLPGAAAHQVVRSLLNGGFVDEIPAPVEAGAEVNQALESQSPLASNTSGHWWRIRCSKNVPV